jgi:thiosulfate reductase cytochrome b subunit
MEATKLVHRHSAVTRLTHWVHFFAFLALVSSGLQIFNAAPYLDASDKSDPSHRVLEIGSPAQGQGAVMLFGHTFSTTGWLGWGDDGMGGRTARAFPAWITIPAYQDLADGRRWHFFFAWIFLLCGGMYVISGAARRDFAQLVLRPSSIPKLIPMQLYYLKLRKEPPPYDKYNPLQQAAYTLVIFVIAPLLVLTGLALSPGFDAWFPWLTHLFGGRQFARLWHFVLMLVLIGFFATHLVLVLTTGFLNNMRGILTGWEKLHERQGSNEA